MANEENNLYSNKMAIVQVLGGLASNPLLLGDDKYKFSLADFPEEFHQCVYKAIVNIACSDGTVGIKRVDPIDVDQWLKKYPAQYKVFNANDGATWLRNAMRLYDTSKFPYYYRELKKGSLLIAARKAGIDVTDLLDPNEIDPVKITAMREKLDSMSVEDIINTLETRIIKLKDAYVSSDDVVEAQAGQDIRQHVEDMKKSPEIGAAFASPLLTTAFRGQRLGTFVMESSAQGVGKSRRQTSEAAHLAIPEYYDVDKKEWVKTGYSLPVLHISTELSLPEVQDMWLAYVSGVEEERIKVGKYTEEEAARIDKACDLISKARLYFVSISNYNIDDIINLIKKYVLTRGVMYVYYDYLSSTEKIMAASAQATRMALREDQILVTFSSKLKDLAKILGIFIYTATQVSGNWKEAKEPDQQLLRGAKALADKPDGCWVLLPVREADKPLLETYQQKGFVQLPTHVLHIFKNRGNPYTSIRIYGYFKRNICRWTDCFVTDYEGHMLDMVPTEVIWDQEETTEPPEKKDKISDDNAGLIETTNFSEKVSENPVDTSWGGDDGVDFVDPDIFSSDETTENQKENSGSDSYGFGFDY